jgi:hypothetical protein
VSRGVEFEHHHRDPLAKGVALAVAVRRSRERADFWLWLLRYRQQSRPFLIDAIAHHAPHAVLHVLRNPQAVERFVEDVSRSQSKDQPDRVN